jgi:hypothetical protein
MESLAARTLAKFLLDLHDSNIKNFARHPQLSRCKKFSERNAFAHKIDIFFTDKNSYMLSAQFEAMLMSPTANTESPYLLIDLEPSDGWIKIFRLVATDAGSLNAEVIFLKAELGADRSFGFRYEHPEVFGDGPGADKHAFFHVQPIKRTTVRGQDVDLPGSERWIPTSTPAFFMMANCTCEVVLYAIHSACGWMCLKALKLESYVLKRFLMVGEASKSAF